MADAPKATGKGLKKKYGPLPVWGWGMAAVGTYVFYRYLKSRSAASASSLASGLTGGTTIPSAGTGPTPTVPGGAGTFATTAAWEQALLTFLTGNGLTPAEAYAAVTAFLAGNCVSQAAYNGISAALTSSSVGLPPGFEAPPTLTVCAGSTGPKSLPHINSNSWPQIFKYGTYGPGEFTRIGTVENGVSDAPNVAGGVPVFAGVFGGFAQGFNTKNLPNGTGIYIPTIFLPYLTGPIAA